MPFFEEILFFKAKYNTKKANKQFTYFLPVGFLRKEEGHETDVLQQNYSKESDEK